MPALSDFHELASIDRGLLAMALLIGSRLPGTPDLRGTAAPDPAA